MSGARSSNLRGAAIMLVAVFGFSLMDTGLKVLSPHYSAMQVASIRGLTSLPLALGWVLLQGGLGQLLRIRLGLHLLRGALGISSLVSFTYGLRQLPLASAYTIFFAAPLLITIFAALVLRERIGRRRWIAIAVGFAGTLLVLRPSGQGTLSLSALMILATAVTYAATAITTRVVGRTDSTPAMVFWMVAMVGVGAGLLALPSWRPIQAAHWPAIALVAVAGSLGQWGITEAFKLGQASFIAPLEYTALLWGIAIDWLVWHTLPGAVTLLGASVIIGTGVYLIRGEREHAEAEHP